MVEQRRIVFSPFFSQVRVTNAHNSGALLLNPSGGRVYVSKNLTCYGGTSSAL
jgi:hypothetical protein